MGRKYFGTDGIRGRANGVITPELALKVGQATGCVFRRGDYRHRVVIGKDTRLSGYMIETALVAGVTSVRMDVLVLGPIPTPAALWELGAEVFSIGTDPDGFNINKDCGSTAPEALTQKVREMRADIGIALDGDADRVVIVDERGHVVDGDQLLAVIAESWKDDGLLAKPGVVSTVMSNLGLEKFLRSLGIDLVRTPVGDRYVLEHMREHGFNLGGEPSGHIILSDYTTTGDGFVAALQVLAVVKKRGEPVSEGWHP